MHGVLKHSALLKTVAIALAVMLAPVALHAQVRRVPADPARIQLSFAPLVKQAAPAVANIYTRRVVREVVRSPLFDDPFFRQFFGGQLPFAMPRRRIEGSLGSGVIVTPDGLIVTNHHVIEGASQITVALADHREFEADLVLDDERTDLAVLRIRTDGERLPYLPLGNSDDLEVGDLVLAIGNPFNIGQTVTSGIVSALARTGVGITDYQFFIQTDAAINPGNSGGALIAMDGSLVGINTAIFSRSGGSLGIGFAIPANMVRIVVESAKAGLDYVQRPWFGAAVQPVTPDLAAALGLGQPHGALVSDVYPESPAARAGIRPGDVVVAVDGAAVEDPAALAFRLGTGSIGDEAKLTLLRDGHRQRVALPLVKAPEAPPRDVTELGGSHALAGATVANLSPAFAEELRLDPFERGVIVLEVRPDSMADRLQLRPGDRIERVDDVAIETVDQLERALRRAGREVRFTIRRGDRTLRTVVRQ